MPRKVRTNHRRAGANVTDLQLRWLNGEDILHSENTMEALSLLCDALGKNSDLWEHHGDKENFFWRRPMDQPITREDLEHHEACWLESGEGDNDHYGGESFFIWKHFNDAGKIALWETFGDKENFHWESILRRPIPKGASVDAAMVAFGDPTKSAGFPNRLTPSASQAGQQ
jgi:hypothetical protein